jgi:hypothetical protein
LDDTEIDAELQLFAAILACHLPNLDLSGLVRPVTQDLVQVEAHACTSNKSFWR